VITPDAIGKNITLTKTSGQFQGDAPSYDTVVDTSFKTFWEGYSAK
jgi:hypothetical protein